MSAAHFDTLDYIEGLIRVGIDPLHAEAITKATAKAITLSIEGDDLVSKKDLYQMKVEIMQAISASTWKIVTVISTIQAILFGLYSMYHALS